MRRQADAAAIRPLQPQRQSHASTRLYADGRAAWKPGMQDDNESLLATIAALEAQRALLGDAVVDTAVAPLRARLESLQRAVFLKQRQVTVLFADMVGSTAMAQGLDAEDTLAVVGAAMQSMADIVLAHRGRVLRYTGDGIKAAFGMDAAHEDDAERAVRVGLAILEAGRRQAEQAKRQFGIANLDFRVGLHTGSVAMGAGLEADNTAMGVAVNIAARMEQSTAPGTLRISHDTWSQVRGLFDMEPQPPLMVKGVEVPMQTYLVRAALDRTRASVERGLQGLATPMVGRDADLQRLLQAVAQARQTRHLHALTLVGEAGLGKSRLLRELTAALRAELAPGPGACRVIMLRSQPDGLLRSWGLLRTLLATQFSVADTDSADVARRKVVEGLSPCFDERGEQQAQLIGHLSGLDFGDSPHLRGLDPRSLRDQAFNALRAYLQALARDGVLPVLLVEDLHWADDGSLDLLQHLMSHAAELPLALLMSGRPALLQRRPNWGAAETTVQLSPLAAAQSDELAQALLQRMDEVPQKLTELIVGRGEGNPYYMEELLRRLVDDGVISVGEPHWTVQLDRLDTVRLPSTLIGLLQARLDALPAAERQAARQASIVGHVFWDDALKALDAQAPQALPALQRAAMVRDHDRSDIEGTPERQFDHHLLHQVTYETLLKAERKLGHGAAARWLQERTQGRGAEFLAMTGEHAERAGETALAVDCFEQAGKEAEVRFANTAAVLWMRRALDLLGESDPARRLNLLRSLQATADTMGNRSAQDAVHAEMAALLERHPDDTRQAQLWHSQAMLADRRGDRVLSESYSRQACEQAKRCGAAETAALSHGLLAWLHFARHENDAAREHLEPGLHWAGRIEAESDRARTEARLLTLSGMVLIRQSRYDEAGETLLDVLARGQSLGSPQMQLGALDNLAVLDALRRRFDDVARWGERMLALAETTGNLPYVVKAQWRLTRAAGLRNDSAAELYWCERNLPLTRAVGDRTMEASTLRRLAALRRKQGDLAAALLLYQEAQAVFLSINDLMLACETAANAASCELDMGRTQVALLAVNDLLATLNNELAKIRAPETLALRVTCYEILSTLGDARGDVLLEQLHADVMVEVCKLAEPADRERLIADHATYRNVLDAYRRRDATA